MHFSCALAGKLHLSWCCSLLVWLQTSAGLQTKLRRGNFQLLDRPPRMLPRLFNPVQLNVDCSAKTPVKEAEGKKGKRARGGKASGEGRGARPNSGGGRAAATGDCTTLVD